MNQDQESLRELKETEDRLKELYRWTRRAGWTWRAAGAAAGLGSGALAAAVGSLLSALALARGDQSSGLSTHGVGSILLLSTVPLLVVGAHCLDLLDRKVERGRQAATKGEGPAAVRGRHAHSGAAVAVIMLMLLCGAGSKAHAQQTIFNVPSSDVLDKGKVYFELDATFKPDDSDAVGKFSSFVPRVVVGMGGRVEVGLNVTGNIQPGPDSTTLVPAIKWKAYDGGDNGWSIVLGDHLFVPIRNKSYDAGNYVYAQVSKSFKTKTRLTAGGYHFTDNVVATNAQRAGGQFGFEQPVTDKFGVAADWYTGKHAAGYFTPGINFKPHPKVTGYVGYSVGNANASKGNHFVYMAVGVNFN